MFGRRATSGSWSGLMTCRIAVLLTCHNRRCHTVECLRLLAVQTLPPRLRVRVFLVDDGSTDGTAEAIRMEFPDAYVIPGSGQLYWNGGIRLALSVALAEAVDFYFLLNDDTKLFPHALASLLDTACQVSDDGRCPAIVVGSTKDPFDRRLSYGGYRRQGWKALDFVKVNPQDQPIPCDTFNGNCVLIPRVVMESLGNLDAAFTHSMGDMDLGLRARQLGFEIWMAPGYVGTCEANSGCGLWTDKSLPIRKRWQLLLGSKGLPPREWRVFTA